MKISIEELELLAAGYVLDDLDEAESKQVEELIESSSAMREKIRQSFAVMGILANDTESILPPESLKKKIKQTFEVEKDRSKVVLESENIPQQSPMKKIINLENWFQEKFESGWQTAVELLETSTLTPAFRSSGVEGAKMISFDPEITPIVLIVRIMETSTCDRDIAVEILPQLKYKYLPSGLQLILLDSDGDTVMEATTRQKNKNLKFDFSGMSKETFSIKLELFDRFIQEDFIL